MYLTYSKSLPSFDQHMVQLEYDVPDVSKVYVGFGEGFVALAAKYYEALSSPVVEAPTVADPVALVLAPEPAEAVVAPIDEDVVVPPSDSAPVLHPVPAESVVAPVEDEALMTEEVIEDVVAPVVKRTRKSSV